MKNILKIFILTLFFSINSCQNYDFGDINESENATTTVDYQALFTGAQVRFMTLTGRDYLLKPTLYVQYQSQRTYTDEQRYNEAAGTWTGYYVQTLSNLDMVIDFFSQSNIPQSYLLDGSAANQKGTAMIYSVMVWKRITDSFGDIPYTEALDYNIFTPAYTKQEIIYKDLIAKLKEARDLIDETQTAPSGDLVYGGDILKWKKLANSLILQLSMQLSNKDFAYAKTEFIAALNDPNGVIENVEDEAWHTYANIPGFENPFPLNRRGDYGLSKTFTDALQGEGSGSDNPTSNLTPDDRLKLFSNKSFSIDGIPYGIVTTSYSGSAKLDFSIWDSTAPLPYMTSSYTYLNRAEAAVIFNTGEDAANMLEQGILKSYETIQEHFGPARGSDTENIDILSSAGDYATARLTDASTNMLKVIGEEKWVSLFPMGFDAWAEWRRTGYPLLVPSTQALNNGQIPRRYLYPSTEKSVNVGNYNAGVASLIPATDNNTSRIWWDQQ